MSAYNYLFKVSVIGNSEETLDALRYPNNIRREFPRPIIGVDFGIDSVYINDVHVRLQLWFLAYQPRFNYIRPMYYRGTAGALILTDQTLFQTLGPYIHELITSCGPVPVTLVIRCTSKFVEELMEYSEDLNQLGIELPIVTDTPSESLQVLTENMLNRQNGAEWGLSLCLIANKISPWIFQTDTHLTAEMFLEFLNEQVQLFRDWETVGTGLVFNDPSGFQPKITEEQQETFYSILKALGAEIDDNLKFAYFKNRLGHFQLSLIDLKVGFLPLQCSICKQNCKRLYKSLCIIQENVGWTNFGLPSHYLLALAKVYAIQNETFPNHVWNQIKQHQKCKDMKIEPPPPLTTPPLHELLANHRNAPRNHNPPPIFHPEPLSLRDEMLRELTRLKAIMRGS